MLDTLSFHTKRAIFAHRDMSDVSLPHVVKRADKFLSIDGLDKNRPPEKDALMFYMMNHAFSLVQQKFHPDESLGKYAYAVDTFFKESATPVARMFYYLLFICTRESRHVHKSANFYEGLKEAYGQANVDFLKSIAGTGSSGAVSALMQKAPAGPIGKYTDMLVTTFYKGKFSGGYGGKAWGEIADCLNEFVHGRTNAEAMLDTGFTLAHNNGPIFNKGICYAHHGHDITKILDVQRGGYIPQLIVEHAQGNRYISNSLVDQTLINRYKKLAGLFPEEFTGICDWFSIEQLGAMGSYESQKAQQIKTHGVSPAMKEAEKIAAQKIAAKEAKAEAEAALIFEVLPNLKVKKLTREQLTENF